MINMPAVYFDMWNGLDEQTKVQSVFAVDPYDHSSIPDSQPIAFKKSIFLETFTDTHVNWFNSIWFCKNYTLGQELEIDFSFDEHAFVIRKGKKLRIDVFASAFPWYVRHTNNKGLLSLQTYAKIADNTIIADKSSLTVFFEK